MLSVEKADIVGVGEACVEGKGGANLAGCGMKRLRLRSRKIDVELKSDDLKLKGCYCMARPRLPMKLWLSLLLRRLWERPSQELRLGFRS